MDYTRPRSRGEAALSRHHRSQKISATDRGIPRVPDGRECVVTVVPVGVNTIDAVEQPYVVFDQRDRRIGNSGGHRETLRAVSSQERAS